MIVMPSARSEVNARQPPVVHSNVEAWLGRGVRCRVLRKSYWTLDSLYFCEHSPLTCASSLSNVGLGRGPQPPSR